ncbi:MAG: DEAD/DEAH box helicase, partial [Acidobacteria bacterium]|nr:DEAD/DEAH box helicase [Acidobacteriota bacterium]
DIYQRCRKTEEIKTAFDQLQLELNLEINQAMTTTRRKLLENFDDEVREKLRVQDEASRAVLTRFEQLLMRLTRHELNEHAEFLDDSSFRLRASPFAGEIPLGLYELPRRSGEALTYRLNHPLAEAVIAQAKSRELPPVEIQFYYSGHQGKISVLEPFIGESGWLTLSLLSVESLDQAEDHLIFAAVTDDGQTLDEEIAARLLPLPGSSSPLPQGEGHLDPPLPPGEGWGEGDVLQLLGAQTRQRQAAIQRNISERNARFFEAEADKLEGWADDLKVGLEREIKELDRQIKEARRAATTALTLEEKLAGQKQIKALEAQRNQKRRSLFDAQDQVDKEREELIAVIEGKLKQATTMQRLFILRWKLS